MTITAPAAMTVTADQLCPQGDCAQVIYSFTVSGGYPQYTLICTPLYSGSLYPVGSYTVSCMAQDSRGDSTPFASFALTVTTPSTGGGGSPSGGSDGGTGAGSSGAGSSDGSSSSSSSSSSSDGMTGSVSGGSSVAEPAASQVNTTQTVHVMGAPRIGQVLIARVTIGRPMHYAWQVQRAGTWRLLAAQTTSRLPVKAAFLGDRLRARITLWSGRVLYSSTTAPVHH